MSCREELQDALVRLHLAAGLGMSRIPPKVLEEVAMGESGLTVSAPLTKKLLSGIKWMDAFTTKCNRNARLKLNYIKL